jgi:sacsin
MLCLRVQPYLPLHVRRRELWHGGELAGSGRQRAEWNVALLQDGVAPAYVRLLHHLAARLGPLRRFYR